MALAVRWLVWRKSLDFQIIDAHFAYPDGYAARWLARWLNKPFTVTMRGTEPSLARFPGRHKRIIKALMSADSVIAVADSLRRYAVRLGVPEQNTCVVGNGVDTEMFFPVDRRQARQQLQIPEDAKVLISVGGLVPRKGFHRVLDCLPELLKAHPDVHYLIVGGESPEGNIRDQLERQVQKLELGGKVHFVGHSNPEQLSHVLSAADVFVLSTSNEGWANVFLEAMACGLPVVTTNVGGNPEVVNDDAVGMIVPFDDQPALIDALDRALTRNWQSDQIIAYAKKNAWENRVEQLEKLFKGLLVEHRPKTQEVNYVGQK
jgi:glycosyltransferase involved in cell wall biosynthesis